MDRAARSSSGAVAPTTRPTVPPGPQLATSRATRAQSGSSGPVIEPSASQRARTRRPWISAAPGLDVRHRTYANRSDRSRYDPRPSSPTYGLIVTASKPRPSKYATDWRIEVVSMSPRFPSPMTGTSPGMRARSRSSIAQPRGPERLVERRGSASPRPRTAARRPAPGSRTPRLPRGSARSRRAGSPDPDRCRGTARCPLPRSSAARRSRYVAPAVPLTGRCSARRRRWARRSRPASASGAAAAGRRG